MQPFEHGGKYYDNRIRYDFSENINPLGMPDKIRKAIASCPEDFVRYPDVEYSVLRRNISEYLNYQCDQRASRSNVFGVRNICVGNGADELIWKLMSVIKPRNILEFAPTFSEYRRCAMTLGIGVREYTLMEDKDFLPDEGLLEYINEDIDLVFLCNPNNPTGRCMSRKLLEDIISKADSLGIYVVVDESFIEFTCERSISDLINDFSRLMVLRGFTKIFGMAGIRLGYLIGEEKLIESIREYGPLWNVSAVASLAGSVALEDKEWTANWIKKTRGFVDDELALLRSMDGIMDTDANFAMIRTRGEVVEQLLQRGIAVRNCSNFNSLDSSYIRIGVKEHHANEVLIETYKEIING